MKLQSFYEPKDPQAVPALIRRARMGLLVTQSGDGEPQIGWFNASPVEGAFLVHLANEDVQARSLRERPQALLSFSEILSTIPSYWVDPQDGGRATNYYLHVEFQCRAEVLEGAPAMEALRAMMRDYQKEGGYLDLDRHPQVYAGYYPRLLVGRLKILSQKAKWKLGQNLDLGLRQGIQAKLLERGRPEDLRTAQEMAAWREQEGHKGAE